MTIKLDVWSNKELAKKELNKRLHHARKARQKHEQQWEINSRTVFPADTFNLNAYGNDDDFLPSVQINYAFKDLRFLHAQMSANPPATTAMPATSDQADRRKAQAADKVVQFANRQYDMQEYVDKCSLNALIYGTSFMKTVWDSTLGDIIDINEETEELTLDGDIAISVPDIYNIYIDPDADNFYKDVRYLFERVIMPMEEACLKYPEKKDILEQNKITSNREEIGSTEYQERDKEYLNAVEIFEYWEPGLATNGYLGRYCICTADGTPITDIAPSPFSFLSAGMRSKIENKDISEDKKHQLINKLPKKARLPYVILTDIDVPNEIYGKSVLEYAAPLQDYLNKIDTLELDNVRTHGNVRMVVPDSANLQDDSITDRPIELIKISGTQGVHFVSPPGQMPSLVSLRQHIREGIHDSMGTNESMHGQQSREMAGFAMQYATNQGNMIRRRIFNKYTDMAKRLYLNFLALAVANWETKRIITVVGEEKAIESIELSGADIDGGYSLEVKYGTSLSLDPLTRKEEIMILQPLFEKAGVPPRTVLQMMQLNELSNLHDIAQLSASRQREIFETIIATGEQLPPRRYQDHVGMIEYAQTWFMTVEFQSQSEDIKRLCEEHIQIRFQVAQMEQQAVAGPQGAAGQPLPPGPVPDLSESSMPAPQEGPIAEINDVLGTQGDAQVSPTEQIM